MATTIQNAQESILDDIDSLIRESFYSNPSDRH